jgi:hypothetical protein
VNLGSVSLLNNETALLTCENTGELILLSVARNRGCLRTASDTEPTSPQEGDEWFDTDNKISKVYSEGEWVPQSATTTLEGFVLADGNSFASAVAGTSLGTGNTLVLRGSEGQAVFAGTTQNAITATYTSLANSPDKAAVSGSTNAINAYGVLGLHTSTSGWGVSGQTTTGLGGVLGTANAGTGVQGTSTTGIGGKFTSSSGTYHAQFGDTGNDRFAISRVRGWLNWFYGIYTGKLQTSNITANRTWVLPDSSGTVMLSSGASSTPDPGNTVVRDGDGAAEFTSVIIDVLKITNGQEGKILEYSAEAGGYIPAPAVYEDTPTNAVDGEGGTPGWRGRVAINDAGQVFFCTQNNYTESNNGWVVLATSYTW